MPPDRTIVVTVIARERGGTASGDTVGATLYASSGPSLTSDATQLSQFSKRLASGSPRSIAFSFRVADPATLPDNNYYLVAAVTSQAASGSPPGLAVSTQPISFVHPLVQYSGTFVSQPNYPVVMGRRRTGIGKASVLVTNTGNIAGSGSATVTLFASADGLLDASAETIGSARASRVLPGKSKAIDVRLDAPYDLPAGSYSLLATVSPPDSASSPAVATAANPIAFTYAIPVFVIVRNHRTCYYGEDDGELIDFGDDAALTAIASGVAAIDTSDQPPSDLSAAMPATEPTTNPTTEPADGSDSGSDNSGDDSSSSDSGDDGGDSGDDGGDD